MLRHYDQHGGGVKVYTQGLLREMLHLTTPHEFVLIYRNPRLIGSYGEFPHVREIALTSRTRFTWDQVAMKRVEKTEKVDLIFNPKYSIPLTAGCRTVFVCHGIDWNVVPRGSKWTDRLSNRFLYPRYARKGDAIIAVSNTARQSVIETFGLEEDRVHTVYHGVDDIFKKPIPLKKLEETRRIYQLPERFFLYVGQIYPPKNFGRVLRAYSQVGPALGIYLVVAGEHRWLCKDELALVDRLGISSWVVWPGWIDHDTLPGFYALAEALILPSLYEACPIPILEAMSSRCPIVTSNRYGTRELAGEAGVLVDPEEVESIANGMRQVVMDKNLRRRLVEAGHKRAANFTWKTCAQNTLRVLEGVFAQG